MSDSSDQDELQTVNLIAKKERKKRVLSEEAKIKMRENLSLARAKRAQTKADRLATLTEEKSLLKELLEEKKKSKAMLAAKKKPVKKKVESETESELSSESETESESESDSSEEESEFVLSRRASKTSSKTSSKKALREKLLAAELALAKRKKHSKVNVYVGHPEPKMSDQAKRQILDL